MNRTALTTAAALAALVAACAQDNATQTEDAYASADTPAEAQEATTTDAYGTEEYGADDTYADASQTDDMPGAYGDETVSDDVIAEELAGQTDDTYAPAEPMPAAIAEDEALSQSRDEFAMADTNGDGALTRDEFLATMTPTAAGDYGTPVGEGDASYGDEIGDTEMADAGQTAQADTDATRYLSDKFRMIAGPDEEVTVEELENAAATDFASADANGDQVLEGNEVETYAALKAGRTTY